MDGIVVADLFFRAKSELERFCSFDLNVSTLASTLKDLLKNGGALFTEVSWIRRAHSVNVVISKLNSVLSPPTHAASMAISASPLTSSLQEPYPRELNESTYNHSSTHAVDRRIQSNF